MMRRARLRSAMRVATVGSLAWLRSGPPGAERADQLHTGHRPDLLAHLVGGGDDRVVELLQRGPPRLDCSQPRCAQHAKRFDTAITGLGDAGPLSVERGTGGGDRVQRVVFAAPATGRAIGPRYLEHCDPGGAELPRDTGAVGAGLLDTDPVDRAEVAHPTDELPVALTRRRERSGAEHLAAQVNDRGSVQIFVRVDPAHDERLLGWHAAHC